MGLFGLFKGGVKDTVIPRPDGTWVGTGVNKKNGDSTPVGPTPAEMSHTMGKVAEAQLRGEESVTGIPADPSEAIEFQKNEPTEEEKAFDLMAEKVHNELLGAKGILSQERSGKGDDPIPMGDMTKPVAGDTSADRKPSELNVATGDQQIRHEKVTAEEKKPGKDEEMTIGLPRF